MFLESEADARGVLAEFQVAEDLSVDLVNTATMVIGRDAASGEEIEVLAVRGDQHALAQRRREQSVELVLCTVSKAGQITAEERFSPRRLSDVLQRLDRLWVDEIGADAPVGLATFVAAVAAMNPLDRDALSQLWDPNMSLKSHLSLNQLLSSDGREEALDKLSSFLAGLDTIGSKILRIDDHLILALSTVSQPRRDSDCWVTGFVQLARERRGRIDLVETWDPGDVDLATARFDELAGGPAETSAVRWSGAFSTALSEGRVEDAIARIAKNATFSSRQQGTFRELSVDEWVAGLRMAREISGEGATVERDTVATSGDRVVLGRTEITTASEMSVVFLGLVWWSRNGRIEGQISFDDDDLAAALLEIAALSGERVRLIDPAGDPIHTPAFEWSEPLAGAYESGSVDDVLALMADDFVFDMRRTLVQGEIERDQMHDWVTDLVTRTGGIELPFERLAFAGPNCLMSRLTVDYGDSQSSLISVNVWADGRLRRVVQFDDDQVELALAELETRAGAPAVLIHPSVIDHADTPPTSMFTTAQREAASVGAMGTVGSPRNAAVMVIEDALGASDVGGFAARFAADVDYQLHFVLTDPDGSRPQLLDAITSLVGEGWTWTASPIAVAGDRHAVVGFRATADQAGFLNEWVASIEIDEAGLCSRFHLWDTDDVRLALVDCRRRYLAATTQLTEAAQREYEFEMAWNEHTIDALVPLMTDDFRTTDHRPTSLLGALDRHQWCALQKQTIADMANIASWMDVIESAGDVNFLRHRRWSDPRLEPDWDFYVVSDWAPVGMRSADVFDLDQRAEAVARFEELAGDGLSPVAFDDPRNAASDTYVVQFAPATWTDDPGDLSHLVVHDMVYDVHKPGTGGGGGLAELLATGASWASVGFSRKRLDVVAVRGERHALVTGVNATDDGYELAMAGVVECGDDGRIVYLGIWDDSDLRLAAAEYGRRILASGNETYPTKAFTELMSAANSGDTEKMAAVFSPDVVLKDHAAVGFGEMSVWEFRKSNQALTEMVSGLVLTSPQVIRQSGDVAMELNRRSGLSVDGGDVSFDKLLVYVVNDGLIVRFEGFDPEDHAAAEARFDELVAAAG